MKHPLRILLPLAALGIGGGLGYLLLREPDHIKIIVFLIVCFALGNIFYRIDRKFFKT